MQTCINVVCWLYIVYVQKWRKGWVVISTKELLNCTLEYYKDEDQWLAPSNSTKKITISVLLQDIMSVKHIRSTYKCHIMSIAFDDYSIMIGLKSQTTMQSWITKLNNIRGSHLCMYCILVHKINVIILCIYI